MDIRIEPHELSGTVTAIPSKSIAHRLVILAACADRSTDIYLTASSEDIDATLRCVEELGARVEKIDGGLCITPVGTAAQGIANLDVGESGSTLRFLLPVVAALRQGTAFHGRGRLAERPLSPLDTQLMAHGVSLSERGSFPLVATGRLQPGTYRLPGSVSSQFVSGLLLAAPLLSGKVTIDVEEPVESKGYIDLTTSALATFGVTVHETRRSVEGTPCRTYEVAADQHVVSPGTCHVEGDWSNASFWLAAGALQKDPLFVTGLNHTSRQGDRSIMAALALLGARIGRSNGLVSSVRDTPRAADIDVSAIPDLAAPLAAVASVTPGITRLRNAGRLRLKESDRLATITSALNALGGHAQIDGDSLVIEGVERLCGGTVDAAGDHRIAMMAAVCATQADGPTIIHGAECVSKSYPSFFEDYVALGGKVSREAF